MNLVTSLATGSLLAALAACATQTPYQAETRGFGYAEEALDDRRYRVSFHGSSDTAQQRVKDALLLRMADLTLGEGESRFTVEDRETDCLSTIRTDANTTCTYRQSTDVMFPYILVDYDKPRFLRAEPVKEYEAIAVMRLGGSEPCMEEQDCYEAAAVAARFSNLRE